MLNRNIKLFFLCIFFFSGMGSLFAALSLKIEYLPSEGKKIHSVDVDKNGKVWLSTGEGSFVIEDKQYKRFFPQNSEDEIQEIISTPMGEKWVWFKKNKILKKITSNTSHQGYYLGDSLRQNYSYIKKIQISQDEIWTLNDLGQITVHKKQNSQSTILKGYPNIYDFVIDEKGYKWFGSIHGLFIMDPQNNVTVKNPFLFHVKSIFIRDKSIYILEKGFGENFLWKGHINDLHFKTWKRVPLPGLLSEIDIKNFNVDSNGNVWIASDFIYVLFPDGNVINLYDALSLNVFQKSPIQKDENGNEALICSNGRSIIKIYLDIQREIVIFQGKPIELNQKVEVNDLLFEINDVVILPSSYGVLNELSDLLRKYSNTRVIVEGHTSKGIRQQVLLAISRGRASSVKHYLVKKGISEARIITKGHGDTQLKNTLRPESDENKRVEITIKKIEE